MNVVAYQEKENEKIGKRKTEEKKRTTNFKETVCCLSAVKPRKVWQKNGMRGVPRVTRTLGKTNSNFDPTQMGSRTVSPC